MSEITSESINEAREPIFTVDTVYDMERLLRFNTSHFLGKKWFVSIMSAATVLVILSFLLNIALIGFDMQIFACVCAVCLLDALYLFLVFVMPRFTYKKSPAYMSNSHLEFFDDGFSGDSKTSSTTSHTDHKYDVLKKLRESKTDIYLYIAPNQAYIISKDGFTKGNAESFKRFLYTKVDPKIVKYKS